MSYDVELVIDTGGEYPATVTECRSPTYNLAPMFREALGIPMSAHADSGGGHLDGMLARDALPILNRAIERMCSEPDRFRALNPPNGRDALRRSLDAVSAAAERYLDAHENVWIEGGVDEIDELSDAGDELRAAIGKTQEGA